MKRTRQSNPTPNTATTSVTVNVEREEDPVPEALQKFQESLDTKFPLKRLRDLHDESKIKDLAIKEREKTHKEFVFRVLKFTGDRFGDLWKDLENGIQRSTQELIMKNQQFRKEFEGFCLEAVCLEYNKAVEIQLTFLTEDTGMDLEKVRKVLEDEKNEVLKSFPKMLGYAPPLDQLNKLKGSLALMQAGFEERLKRLLNSPGGSVEIISGSSSSSSSTGNGVGAPPQQPTAEELKYEEMKTLILQRIETLKAAIPVPSILTPFKPNVNANTSALRSKLVLDNFLKEIRRFLEININEVNFPGDAYKRKLSSVAECLTMASGLLNREYLDQPEKLPVEDGVAWVQALESDIKHSLGIPNDFQGERRIGIQAWANNLMCSKISKFENGNAWRLNEDILRKYILKLVPFESMGLFGLEPKTNRVEKGDDRRSKPEAFLSRLRKILRWEKDIKRINHNCAV